MDTTGSDGISEGGAGTLTGERVKNYKTLKQSRCCGFQKFACYDSIQ